MICASRPVPSVVTTSACVSPRVNSAEPCVRGSTPVRIDDRAHGLHVAAVDARLAGEDAPTHDAVFEVGEFRRHVIGVELRRIAAGERLRPLLP